MIPWYERIGTLGKVSFTYTLEAKPMLSRLALHFRSYNGISGSMFKKRRGFEIKMLNNCRFKIYMPDQDGAYDIGSDYIIGHIAGRVTDTDSGSKTELRVVFPLYAMIIATIFLLLMWQKGFIHIAVTLGFIAFFCFNTHRKLMRVLPQVQREIDKALKI